MDGNVFDLSSLLADPTIQGRYKPIRDAIDDVLKASSVRSDLQAIMRALFAIRDIDLSGNYEAEQIYGSALMVQAVITYTRAVEHSKKGPNDFDLEALMDDDAKLMHIEVQKLRDDTIAHFGKGKGI